MKQILIRPLITEKVNKLTEKHNEEQYAFLVHIDANKIEIRQAIEQLYQVEVRSVRTVIQRPKHRSRFTKTGILRGKTERRKKAFISVAAGQKIDHYSNV